MLEQMTKEIKSHLLEVINPFWKMLTDRSYGGFYGYVDEDLIVDAKAPKGVILNSRILWFFSNAYLTLKQKENLSYAKHAFEFLKNHCIDETYGGVYWMLDYTGQPIEDMKHTYNQAFAIYALSSYYDASKDPSALKLAQKLYDIIETICVDEYGYLEAFDRTWVPISNEKLSDNKHLCAEGIYADKTMNTLLHVLEAYTELYRVSQDAKVGEKLKEILIKFEKEVFNKEKDQLEVFFDLQMHTIADMHSYGHDIEAAWLLDRAAQVLGDSELIERTKAYTTLLDYKVKKEAFVNGSLNNERFRTLIDTTKVWWVQAETVVGFINAYEQSRDEAFLEAAKEEWEFIKKYVIDDRPNSEWHREVDENGQTIHPDPIVEPWKCPYHNGRMCFEVIRRTSNV